MIRSRVDIIRFHLRRWIRINVALDATKFPSLSPRLPKRSAVECYLWKSRGWRRALAEGGIYITNVQTTSNEICQSILCCMNECVASAYMQLRKRE